LNYIERKITTMEDKKRNAKVDKANASIKKPRQQREPLTTTPTDVFAKLPYIFVQFLDRLSCNRLFSTNKEIHVAGRAVTPLPWPEKRFQVASRVASCSVAFSPDGGLVASGSSNGRTSIWNRSDGRCTVLEGHNSIVNGIAFSPDGKYLACGRYDRTIQLWKLDDNSSRILEGHSRWVTSVAFSPDGSTLASGSLDGSVRLWHVSDGRCTKTLCDIRMLGVWHVAWSPNVATITVVNSSGQIYLWDISNEENIIRAPVIIQGHESDVTTIAYSPDGRYLASGSRDNAVKLWSVADRRYVNVFTGHTSWVRSICFSPNGKILASGSCDHSVRLWNVEVLADDSCWVHLPGHHGGVVQSVAFSADGRTLVSGSKDGTVRLCDISLLI
jgi:WD40 repeat protein